MRSPTLDQAAEALTVALVVPASVAAVYALNPLLGVWIAGLGLIHAAVLAFPAFLLLRRFGWVNVATSTVAGFVVGAVPAAAFFSEVPGQFVPFGCFGAISGLVFGAWLKVRERTRSGRAGDQACQHPPLE